MKRDTHDFKGFDGSTAPIKLPKGGYYNHNIKNNICTSIRCSNMGDHVRISDNGFANLVYCDDDASVYLLSELARGEKPRGHWFYTYKGKLHQSYVEKYVAQELIDKVVHAQKYQKRYKALAKYLKL